MKLLVLVETTGDTFPLDLGSDMKLEDAAALLEAETGITTANQILTWNGNVLTEQSATLATVGVQENDMLLLSSKARVQQQQQQPQPGSSSAASSNTASGQGPRLPSESESEMIRLQVLGDPQTLQNLKHAFPDMAAAAEHDPARFRQMLPQLAQQQNDAARQRERNIALLNADPFDVEAQKQIEEAIQQEAVLENMSHAMEYSPESFGSVHMLYVQAEVNKVPIKAFVDSGAQATIMSPECAQQCGLMRLLDRRFAGIARGVGTAKILGRVHSAQIKVGEDLFLGCSFTIMEGKGVDLLFGLDMLKRHQACIDLAQNALIIQGRKVRFLDEHELPKNGLLEDMEAAEASGSSNQQHQSSNPSAALGAAAAQNAQEHAPSSGRASGQSGSSSSSYQPFGGSGNTLGAPSSSSSEASKLPEESIQGLIGLGVPRAEAIRLLEAAGGNPDVAASLMFSG